MLHRLSRLRGCKIHATDGEIGHVDDLLVDEHTFAVQYLVVDTSNWIGGKWVAISPSAARKVDWGKLRIDIDLTRDQIKAVEFAPELGLQPRRQRPSVAGLYVLQPLAGIVTGRLKVDHALGGQKGLDPVDVLGPFLDQALAFP